MQEGSFAGVARLGRKLSMVIGCPVRWLGRDRNIFVCAHNISFSISRLVNSNDWSWAKEEHRKAVKDRR